MMTGDGLAVCKAMYSTSGEWPATTTEINKKDFVYGNTISLNSFCPGWHGKQLVVSANDCSIKKLNVH